MNHIHSLIHNVYNEIFGRPPSMYEYNTYARYLRSYPSGNHQIYEAVFKKHLQNQAKKFVIFPPRDDINEDTNANINIREKKLLIVGLMRNVGQSIVHVQKLIKDLRGYFQEVKLYFYHNNSSDDSVNILKKWIAGDSGVAGTFAESSNITVVDNASRKIGNRIPMFAKMRNENVTDAFKHFGKDFDYMLMANTDLEDEVDVSGIIKSLGLQESWNIICGNCCFQKSFFHYDAYALRLLGEPDDIRQIYPDFDRSYGWNTEWMDRYYAFDGWAKVKCGFGDMSIIKMPPLLDHFEKASGQICTIDEEKPHICELISMCEGVGGDVWVSPYLVYPATMKLELEPYCYIPRDAGFFSVFNFYLGTIFTGQRAYPYYNKKAFDNVHTENKHFCYWSSEKENSWFEYFNPVSFYHGDKVHESQDILTYKITHGNGTGGEFRNPHVYKRMMINPALWNPWRKTAHAMLTKYISIKPKIWQSVDEYWQNIGDCIGVHYRHPSHYVESGKVFLRDYFAEVDELLVAHPDANIFLATDNELGVMAFSYRYKERLHVFPGVKRVNVDNILEWAHEKKGDSMDFVEGRGYQLHYTLCGSDDGKKAGEDVLKEVLCLSRCKWVVHTVSNVALAVSYFNPDAEMHIIHGI